MNLKKSKLEELLDELKERIASLERQLRLEEQRTAYWHERWERLHDCNKKPAVSKPQRKRAISISLNDRGEPIGRVANMIFFCAGEGIAEMLREYGHVDSSKGSYLLKVDGRYDYNDVLAYMKSLA